MMIQMVKNRQNPEQMMLQYLQQQAQQNPMGQNLLSLAQAGNAADIEKIARNICAQRGIDFDKEFASFLRKETGLFLTAGSVYGKGGEGFLRMNVATSLSNVKDACCRLLKGVESYSLLKREK